MNKSETMWILRAVLLISITVAVVWNLATIVYFLWDIKIIIALIMIVIWMDSLKIDVQS
jgi:hypothetical protein